jgi:serine/threonine protein phosphatase 1
VTPSAPRDRDRFARLRGATRIWAIASVHGEVARLAALHDKLWGHISPGDRLVYLGNLLGRGPEPAATVDEVLSFRRAVLGRGGGFACDVAVLRGAQEEMWQKLLQLQFASNPREVLDWMIAHGADTTIRAYGGDPRRGEQACREGALGLTRWTATLRNAMHARPGHTQFMAALRRAAVADHVLFVHGGVDPSRPLDAQGDAFWWARERFIEADPLPGFRRVVRGYDPRHGGLVEAPHAVSLDAGCGLGGPLLAACFDAEGAVVARLES